MNASGRSFRLLFGGIWFAVGLPLFIAGVAVLLSSQRYASEGRTTEGMLLTKEIRTSRGKSGRSTSYHVTYRYTTPAGNFEGSGRLPRERWEALAERGPIEVVYLPGKPGASRPSAESRAPLAAIFLAMGGIFGGVGGWLFFGALVARARDRRLLQSGTPVPARVVAVEATNLHVNRGRVWRVRYEYQDFQGRTQPGCFDLSAEEAEAYAVGGAGSVRFDPAHPSRSVWTAPLPPGS